MKTLRAFLGFFLYLFLAFCLVQSYVTHQVLPITQLEEILSPFFSAISTIDHAEISSSIFSLKINHNKISCNLYTQDQPMAIEGSGVWNGPNIHVNLTTAGEVAPLLKSLNLQSLFITGHYTLQSTIKGSWKNPSIFSSLTIQNGSFESLKSGLSLKNIEAALEGEGKDMRITRIVGTDPQGGKVEGSGLIDLSLHSYIIDLSLESTALLEKPDVKGVFNGNLTLMGNDSSMSVKGNLNARSANISLEESKPTPKTVNITYINGSAPTSVKAIDNSSFPIDFYVNITADNQLRIGDKNFNSEWKASLLLHGNHLAPLVDGSLELLTGEYQISGRSIHISEGRILFHGDPIKNSSISVLGSIDTNTIIAEALVSGPLMNPNLTLKSNPPLAQPEILSHLIFGHGLADITPQQSTQLKKSLKDLKSTSTGANILDNVRTRFGIDRIEITRGTGNSLEDVSLQFGKYLTRGLYVAFNKGITSSSNGITLEAFLNPNLKIQAEFNDSAEGQLHLKWRHDY